MLKSFELDTSDEAKERFIKDMKEFPRICSEIQEQNFLKLTRRGCKEIPQLREMLEKDLEDREKENEDIVYYDGLGFPHYNHNALARKLFPVQQLPDGAVPIYKKKN